MNEVYRWLLDQGMTWLETRSRTDTTYCEANAANKQKLKTSCEKVSCTKHQSNQHNDSWNEMQFCKSNTADRIPSTNNFAVAKLIEFSMKLIRVNEAHHSGLVPELITKIKIISHWGSELKWYPNQQKTTNKAPSPKTSNQPLLEPMRINEVDNKEFVPKGIPAFIEACFEVTQIVPQENRRPKNFCTTP